MIDPSTSTDGLLVQAVGLSLCGVGVTALGERGEETVERYVADQLTAVGFGAESLQRLRHECQEQERAWPFEAPRELLRAVGFARFGAVLKAVRAELGVDGLVPVVNNGPKVIGPAEQRLLAEVPPHHGNVG